MLKTDFLIIGGGIIGLSIAKSLIDKFPGKNIIILEKENDVALHASGRNSGVLHAGFYYSSDSLKAKFTKDGNSAMQGYCRQRNLKINPCEKLVIAKGENELESLFELEKRGLKNKVEVKIITEKDALEIDPNIKTHKYALYSPSTATIDPIEICQSLKKDLIKQEVNFIFEQSYERKLDSNIIETSTSEKIEFSKIINCAGLYADKIARDFDFSKNYTIIPFKGIYLKYSGENKPVRTNVYPVPDLRNPFLGVHFTLTVDGTVKIGPTAIPAFWRENYSGLKNFSLSEFLKISLYEARLFISNSFGFRDLAFREMKKYNKAKFVEMAAELVSEIHHEGFNQWSKPGIRAQLLDLKTFELVQDFVVEGDKNSTHILNAVSPAFTSAFPFSQWVVDNYIN